MKTAHELFIYHSNSLNSPKHTHTLSPTATAEKRKLANDLVFRAYSSRRRALLAANENLIKIS